MSTWSRTDSAGYLVQQGFDAEVVAKVLTLVDRAEFKRRQYPPGPKISSRNFGRDRRLPITNAWALDPASASASAAASASTPPG